MESLKSPGKTLIASVTLLTIFPNCALFSSFNQSYDEDPVARVALKEARPSFEDAAPTLPNQNPEVIHQAVSANEIVLGMKMREVLISWGHPREIQTAGDPEQGNQKWIYRNNLTPEFSNHNSRVVYFEKGLVVGWENAHRSD